MTQKQDPQPKQSETNLSLKPFLFGLSISLLFLVAFFLGGIADRLFVITPLDYIAKRSATMGSEFQVSENNNSLLGQMMQSGEVLSVADVAEVASESVVTVSIKTQQRIFEPFGGLSPFGFNFGQESIQEIEKDIGSGFVVDESGLIVTNRHVVSNPDASYTVIDKNDEEYAVVDIYRDPLNDLAILKVDNSSLPPLALGDSENLRVGEGVIAIGTALGEFRHTVTTGVISGLGRGITAGNGFSDFENLENVIQTDAAINPGNSGGPLIGMNGEVIGVNVAVSASGENIGFALPINVIKESIENFNNTGQFDRPFLGVSYMMISEEAAIVNEVPQGAYVQSVVEGSSADEAGLQPGDIIVSIGGEDLSEESLASIINQKQIGDQVKITYWRDDERREVTIVLKQAEN